MKILLILNVFILSFTTLNFAQKSDFSLEEAVLGQWRQFYPQKIDNLTWMKNKNEFTFLSTDERNIMIQQVGSSNARVLFSLDDLNSALKEEFKTMPSITFESSTEFSFQYKSVTTHNCI